MLFEEFFLYKEDERFDTSSIFLIKTTNLLQMKKIGSLKVGEKRYLINLNS